MRFAVVLAFHSKQDQARSEVYTVRTLILWFINECVITFLAISQCRVVKKWGGGAKAPLAPGSNAYGNNVYVPVFCVFVSPVLLIVYYLFLLLLCSLCS